MKVNVKARPARDKPRAMAQGNSLIWLTDAQGFRDLSCQGYTSLADSPEVSTAVNTIARLIGAMTIHEMQNTPRGDIRIRNRISELVDIEPNRYMTRSNFIQWVVRTMFLQGRGNAVVFPRTERGELRELIPIPAAYAAFVPVGLWDYRIMINGTEFRPDDLLHFAANPGSFYPWLGTGYTVTLIDVANNLKQASHTEKGFMSSKWKPSIIVKVDAFDEKLSTPEGRQKILNDYVKSGEAGEPWLVPAEQFDVKEIRPLTLSDLALADFVKLDRQTVATILGVPPFVLGVGEFKRDEWNNFISTTIMPIAQIIEQELTRKLLPQGDLFFRFNARSLHNYSMDEMVKAGAEMVDRMAMRRNEWRDWMGLEPDPEMDELLALENYIPADRLGDQKKLTGGDA
ncbi:MAG: phage portal protein [Oscillospiraceae bacterium]|nr:phage portal protein [Oscillospiraceae bacterium]